MKKSTDPLDQLIGRNIRRYRIRRGLSQAALGDRIGVSFQQVQKYENAANRVPASRLALIASVLKVPINLLVSKGAEAVTGERQPGFPRHGRLVLFIDFNVLGSVICRNVSER